MISVLSQVTNRISKGSKVSCLYRGIQHVGVVKHADYKLDRYTIRIKISRFGEVFLSRKRHQIEPIEDVEFESVEHAVHLLDDYIDKDFIHHEMM